MPPLFRAEGTANVVRHDNPKAQGQTWMSDQPKLVIVDTNCYVRLYFSPLRPILGQVVGGYHLVTLGGAPCLAAGGRRPAGHPGRGDAPDPGAHHASNRRLVSPVDR
jgi:hypothetical protein